MAKMTDAERLDWIERAGADFLAPGDHETARSRPRRGWLVRTADVEGRGDTIRSATDAAAQLVEALADHERKKAAALAKLSDEERALLGL